MPVTFDKSRNKYVARLTHNGKRHFAGRFDTELEAENALVVRYKMLEELEGLESLRAYKVDYVELGPFKVIGREIKNFFTRRALQKEIDRANLRKLNEPSHQDGAYIFDNK